MKTPWVYKIVIILFSIFTSAYHVSACTCGGPQFFDFIKASVPSVVMKGQVIDAVEYTPSNLAVYIKVIRIFRDDFGITDTIKVYGSKNSAACGLHVTAKMPVGEIVYLGMGEPWTFPQNNPDSLSESFFETTFWQCGQAILKEQHGIVSGPIGYQKKTFISQYPARCFDEDLLLCQFQEERMNTNNCGEHDYTIYPNPISNGNSFYFKNLSIKEPTRVRLFALDGRVLLDQELEFASAPIYIQNLSNGVYLVQVESKSKNNYRKLVISR